MGVCCECCSCDVVLCCHLCGFIRENQEIEQGGLYGQAPAVVLCSGFHILKHLGIKPQVIRVETGKVVLQYDGSVPTMNVTERIHSVMPEYTEELAVVGGPCFGAFFYSLFFRVTLEFGKAESNSSSW